MLMIENTRKMIVSDKWMSGSCGEEVKMMELGLLKMMRRMCEELMKLFGVGGIEMSDVGILLLVDGGVVMDAGLEIGIVKNGGGDLDWEGMRLVDGVFWLGVVDGLKLERFGEKSFVDGVIGKLLRGLECGESVVGGGVSDVLFGEERCDIGRCEFGDFVKLSEGELDGWKIVDVGWEDVKLMELVVMLDGVKREIVSCLSLELLEVGGERVSGLSLMVMVL